MRAHAWLGWALGLGMLTAAVDGEARPSKPKDERFWVEAKQSKTYAQASELSRVAGRALPSVVAITTLQSPAASGADGESGLGAGFVISADGYVLTSAHVVKDAREVKLTLSSEDGPREVRARIVGQDPPTDLALLKMEPPEGVTLQVLPLGSSAALEIADWVVAIGNPFGLQHSVTVGVVSHKGRSDVAPGGVESEVDLLQTDASINPGSSGGPLLDLQGRVIGVANAVNVSGQGIGFAIPIEVAKAVLPQLRAHGEVKRGWLGISVQDVTPELARTLGLGKARGVLVSDVTEGGPGARAGLRVGDLITRVDTSPIIKASHMRWEVNTRGVGHPVRLSIEREGRHLERELALEASPLHLASGKAPQPSPTAPAAAGAP